VSPLESVIAQEISSNGPITVARFMELALYHPEFGYYAAGLPRSGWHGHFLTSAELDRAFGELWARGFQDVWDACGRPDRFDLIEIGPGEGGFAEAVLGEAVGNFARALHYRLVEPSGPLRARQATRLERFPRTSWSASIEEVPAVDSGCLFANEVLDNQPVRVVERRDGDLHEVLVDVGDAGLTLRRVPAAPDIVDWLDRAGVDIRPGGRGEIGQVADRLVGAAAGRLRRGALILCDYGMAGQEANRRPGGTIACYSKAGVDDDFLDAPGTKDITSHVNWTAVERSLRAAGMSLAALLSQRTILKRLGIDDVHIELRRRAEMGGADAVRALSRRQALGILTDPGGLGGIGVLVATRGIGAPRWATERVRGEPPI
jgi:SAM-dependent MidA family methyltransferase